MHIKQPLMRWKKATSQTTRMKPKSLRWPSRKCSCTQISLNLLSHVCTNLLGWIPTFVHRAVVFKHATSQMTVWLRGSRACPLRLVKEKILGLVLRWEGIALTTTTTMNTSQHTH
jgi:hypothetical protein